MRRRRGPASCWNRSPPTARCSSSSTTWSSCDRSPGRSPCCIRARCCAKVRWSRCSRIRACSRSTSGAAARRPMLTVERLDVAYGGSQVLWGVDLQVAQGQVLCLMGRNGVGKTTLLKTVMGLLPARGGRVGVDGTDITRWSTDRRARARIGYVPQGPEIFPHLTVAENLRGAQQAGRRADRMDDGLQLVPALRRVPGRKGGVLSGGEQQMLAIGRAL